MSQDSASLEIPSYNSLNNLYKMADYEEDICYGVYEESLACLSKPIDYGNRTMLDKLTPLKSAGVALQACEDAAGERRRVPCAFSRAKLPLQIGGVPIRQARSSTCTGAGDFGVVYGTMKEYPWAPSVHLNP